MCIVFVYTNPCPKEGTYSLILASNRDEFYSRPTKEADIHSSNPRIISGLDNKEGREGGTWLGVGENGRIAALLNQPSKVVKEGRASRGFLVPDYLKFHGSTKEYAELVHESGVKYDRFGIVLLEPSQTKYKMSYFDNRKGRFLENMRDIESFSNSRFEFPLMKASIGKHYLSQIVEKHNEIEKKDQLIEALEKMMTNTSPQFPDPMLIRAHDRDRAKLLSSNLVHIPEGDYGTRTLTIVLIDFNNHITYHEKTKPAADTALFEDWTSKTFNMDIKQ